MNPILWQPSPTAVANSQMNSFLQYINQQLQLSLQNYAQLHTWSVTHPGEFWSAIYEFCGVIDSQQAIEKYVPHKKMQDTIWFDGARLNFAENLLRHRTGKTALIYVNERGERRELSDTELFMQVSALGNYLRDIGVGIGDRVAGHMPNIPETIIAMLATTSIGAVWSSCSPDFGLQGLLDRFGQIEPKVLFTIDQHQYNGKMYSHLDKIHKLQQQLPSLEKTIVVPFTEEKSTIQTLSNSVHFAESIRNRERPLIFEQLPFNHPIYILYSSGTTGKPKCMVHSAGGTLLQHLKELMLHTDLRPNDHFFFYTTCGWMMWNWMVSGLAAGATLVLYEGSPFYPKSKALFDLIDNTNISVFGIGAKLVESWAKHELEPKNTHQLSALRTILTTGSPLLPQSFDYIYEKVKQDVCLSSISGGSDIVSCFALGNPMLPVYRGELQCRGLGMDVQIFNEDAQPIINEKGELVCCTPFPSMPVSFWNDKSGEKYQHAYFDKYPNVWAHGDYAKLNKHGGMIIYGRSDAILNPGGVRIGTAEIYREVEKIPEVIDVLAVGQNWRDSERIILFVVMRDGTTLDEEVIKKIKNTIRQNTSPRHVPEKIIQAPDLPRTISGKLVELSVKKIIHGEPVKNVEALANPESLEFFKDLAEITT